ncbi:hypothetical protein BpHYR1_034197 [Brachionus plicatilis]|uniref:Uncharacterized protein n=1 Tax=Brachionus plicatilis TaxID=10195 RepID=A0A3M7RVS9_BRAPC|nr:hypothetical protein BpHYR1_034197 [Brachionus plicatilis]
MKLIILLQQLINTSFEKYKNKFFFPMLSNMIISMALFSYFGTSLSDVSNLAQRQALIQELRNQHNASQYFLISISFLEYLNKNRLSRAEILLEE